MLLNFTNVENFGLFHNFIWNDVVRDKGNNILKFTKMNIIYARNYSGKTTLSRLMQCVEDKRKNPYYNSAECDFYFQNNHYSLNNISQSTEVVKVYNVDFVKRNLDWQSDQYGNIKPFSVIGEKNLEIEKQLEFFEPYLNSGAESGNCFEFYESKAKKEFDEINLKFSILDKKIKASLAGYAVFMKNKTDLFNVSITFRQDQLEQKIRNQLNLVYVPLPEEVKKIKEMRVKEVIKSAIDLQLDGFKSFESLKDEVVQLLDKVMKPSIIIERLNTSLIEDWVLKGIHIHKDNNIENCSFCGKKLEEKTMRELDEYFNKEVMDFQENIQNVIIKITKEMNDLKDFYSRLPIESMFYGDLELLYKLKKSDLRDRIASQGLWLKELKEKLEEKLLNIFITNEYIISEVPRKIDISDIVNLIDIHNRRTDKFNEVIESEKNSLTIQAIYEYLVNSEYRSDHEELLECSLNIDIFRNNLREIRERKEYFSKEVEKLRAMKISEISGIGIVNNYLEHYFAINHLRLQEHDNGSSFKVERDGKLAHHLSEGECSLISFCYFMAKLKELEELRNVIIWIDDPISSLDANHIFYIYSLIENELAKPIIIPNQPKEYRYKQIFISTHNLDFLKYLHRLSQPIIKIGVDVQPCIHVPKCTKNVDRNECSYFILERGANKSLLKPMPKYMKNFSTEYNYLFSQILKVSNLQVTDLDEDQVYSFGNNLRKFLEAHLYFKYPTNKISNEDKLIKFISDPNVAVICQRISNEMSHLEECFDRGISVLDIPESQKLAKAVLDILKASDSEQFDALLKSVA